MYLPLFQKLPIPLLFDTVIQSIKQLVEGGPNLSVSRVQGGEPAIQALCFEHSVFGFYPPCCPGAANKSSAHRRPCPMMSVGVKVLLEIIPGSSMRIHKPGPGNIECRWGTHAIGLPEIHQEGFKPRMQYSR